MDWQPADVLNGIQEEMLARHGDEDSVPVPLCQDVMAFLTSRGRQPMACGKSAAASAQEGSVFSGFGGGGGGFSDDDVFGPQEGSISGLGGVGGSGPLGRAASLNPEE